jgi:hypothetical protein
MASFILMKYGKIQMEELKGFKLHKGVQLSEEEILNQAHSSMKWEKSRSKGRFLQE